MLAIVGLSLSSHSGPHLKIEPSGWNKNERKKKNH